MHFFFFSIIFSLPQPWNQPFPQGTLVLSIGEWYLETKLRVLHVFIVTKVSLLLGSLSVCSWEITCVCVYPNPAICMHLYLFLCLFICAFMWLFVYECVVYTHKFIQIPPTPTQHHRVHSSIPPLLICKVFLWNWETSLSLSAMDYLFVQP